MYKFLFLAIDLTEGKEMEKKDGEKEEKLKV